MNSRDISLNWLFTTDAILLCLKCNGKGCENCRGTGKASRFQSRTEAIRRYQESNNHHRCFGRYNKKLETNTLSPFDCGELECPIRGQCLGLHKHPFHIDRLREDSIEYLSRLFFCARAIELKLNNWTLYQSDIAYLIQQWMDDTPQVAVLGAFSSGKSHMLNKLIGRTILPVSRTPTTAVITAIKYGEYAHAVLEYRDSIKITLLSKDAQTPDQTAIIALRNWLKEPTLYGIKRINEIDDRDKSHEVNYEILLGEIEQLSKSYQSSDQFNQKKITSRNILIRSIKKRNVPNISRLIRTFEVIFDKHKEIDISFDNEKNIEIFGKYVTEPALALCLKKAICYFPNKSLLSYNMLDTAGLCSPIGFHKDITSELLQRRPDKILVLLDSRRLESPTNREALLVLRKFIVTQDDYRQVTFALTFWDNALRTHMMEDSEQTLDFSDIVLRKKEEKKFSRKKRNELLKWLTLELGIPCKDEPTIVMLGLGNEAPPEMLNTLDLLWKHIESDCSGWIGVEMWASRWKATKLLLENLNTLHNDNYILVNENIKETEDSNDNDSKIIRLETQRKQIDIAVQRSITSIKDILATQKNKMLLEIENLTSRKLILEYLKSGYWSSANFSLNILQDNTIKQKKELFEIYKGFKYLPIISLDRKLLGIDETVSKEAKEKISGAVYHLKSIWDFILGSVIEFNEENHKAVLKILSNEIQDTFELLNQTVDNWIQKINIISEKAFAELDNKKDSINERKLNLSSLLLKLQKRKSFLIKYKTVINGLTEQINQFSDKLKIVQKRISSCRHNDFQALLYSEEGSIQFQKGREMNLLILKNLPKCKWNYLELISDGQSQKYFPVWSNNEKNQITFLEDLQNNLNSQPITPPVNAYIIKLYLSSLIGKFYFKKL